MVARPTLRQEYSATPRRKFFLQAMMLDYIDEPEIAQKIRAAIAKVYAEGVSLTRRYS